MDFRLKNTAFRLIEALPFSDTLHYAMQKHVTHAFRLSDERRIGLFDEKVRVHLDAFARFGVRPLAQSVCYEFGSGWDLFAALGMSCAGVGEMRCVDIKHLIHASEIESAAAFYARCADALSLTAPDDSALPHGRSALVRALAERYRIRYDAPCDARKTGLDADSVDCILSNRTMEHIPREDVVPIFAECARILRPDGVMSVTIDYQDHWSYADPSVTIYNFLSFTDDQWAKRNPSMHFQNRMRHSDYLAAIPQAGLRIVEVTPLEIRERDRAALQSVTLDKRFRAYDPEDLLIRGAHFVLRKDTSAIS